MWKIWCIFVFGFLVILVPFLGFRVATDKTIFFSLGLLIMAFSFWVLRDTYLLLNRRLHTKSDESDHSFLKRQEAEPEEINASDSTLTS